jgi:glycosyltransferase involved in cell wall biosynthesis
MVTQQEELEKLIQKLGVKVEHVPWLGNSAGKKYLLWGPLSVLRYMWLILRHRVDILNLSGRDAQVYGTFAGRLLGRKVVWTDHGDLKLISSYTEPRQAWLVAWAMRLAHRVIFVAKTEEALSLKEYPVLEGKTLVIYNGVKASAFTTRHQEVAAPTVFSNARVQYAKGFEDLTRAMIIVRKHRHDAKLRVAAGVEDQELLELAQKELGSGFEFLGFQKPEQIRRELAGCWVYVFPSHSEAYPLSTLEAMHAGAPIVASRIGGIPEQITDGQEGLLVPAQDPQALAKAIVELLDDKAARRALGEAARSKAARMGDLEKIVSGQILSLYNSLR